ncbi:MAG TPA: NAD-dependent epimerase/dehydratase family protein [Planctomycetota bacterium]|nr:NAD-dependent epimerase/dehydratase family protein [Planctomycetota bacterium]
MRIVVIGGTGHVGSFMVPRLVELGHETIVVSRGAREPYVASAAWQRVRRVTLDRAAADADGEFGRQIAGLDADVVVDMICFKPAEARSMVDALRGRVRHFLSCGTIWVYGHSVVVPATEDQPRRPFGEYGVNKAAIENYLLGEARRSGFPATVVHPGHIVGPGWMPVNPQGNLNLDVFESLMHGREITLPNIGMETLHHVHAGDVAQVFLKAIGNWGEAVGEAFHAVSPAAVTLRGYAEAVAGWFGQEAHLRFAPWDEFSRAVSDRDAAVTWDHIAHSPNCSIEKARRLLGYEPRYTSLEAIREAIEALPGAM